MAPTVPVVCAGQKEATLCSQKTLAQMMGKSRKVTKGHQDGFVPNYRHAVETMAESEGFGSSGRVDTEMTQSDDSNPPQRRCISLNLDPYDHFGVPLHVHALSTMSKSERNALEIRLKRELDQIRNLQKKVESFPANPVVLSPVSDIRSCSDGQKRPALEISQAAPEQSSQGKKRGPPIHNGPRMKTETGHGERPKQGSPSNGLMKQSENLLKQLMSHKWGWVFNTPVDVVKLKIPDYYKVIKHPMDLGTIKGKISSGKYKSPLDFAADVRLTFDNASTYNPAGTDAYIMAQTLSKLFEQRWKSIEKKIQIDASARSIPLTPDAQMGSEKIDSGPPLKKKKEIPTSNTMRQNPVKRSMTVEDKKNLGADLERLLEELPDSIIDFLKESSSAAGQNNVEEIEIDIEALSDDTLFKLRKLLDDFLMEKKKNQTRGEPCEMELHNDSGLSNSSMQPSRVNDTVDEDVDVDIGVPDPPATSFARLGNERDTAHKNDNSISSSSDLGSSSSDSDTSSSSGDGSDGAKAAKRPKTMNADANLGQNQVNPADQGVGRNQSQNGLNQPGRSSLTKPVTVEVNGDKEGESALSERQVSPDKLYRAALLRNRFADTILKVQEHTLEKGDNLDPERLRLEKEELERRQREERARLLAEAKVAEEARKKAELLEAKRKREMEREAARLALQKMEKTVEINENSRFMEDLELLSSAPPDDLSTFLDNGSPNDGDNNLLGSFKLRGISNPLEQLGLYMKVDEEEDDEVDAPKGAVGPTDDVEEGEIDP